MNENIIIIIINLIVFVGVIIAAYKYRYDKKFKDSKVKLCLYWLAIAMILSGNLLAIYHSI